MNLKINENNSINVENLNLLARNVKRLNIITSINTKKTAHTRSICL